MSELGLVFCSAAFCAIAVKLLDDYLDREVDAVCQEPNSINRLGEGTVAYCLPLLAASTVLKPEVGASLFFAAWALGMYCDFSVKYPSGLCGWQESLLALAIGWLLSSWQAMLFAVLLTAAVQLFDDIIDRHQDRLTGSRNLACRLGVPQCGALCCTCLLIALKLAGIMFWPVFGAVTAVYAAFAYWGRVLND